MTKEEALKKIEELKNYIEQLDHNDSIYLLSIEEYEKYVENIPRVNCCWWLRSPGESQLYAALVYDDNLVCDGGYNVDYNILGVRPALKYSNLKVSESQKGDDYFMFNEVRWKIIDKEQEIAISELPIGFERFDSESNVYENSEIRKWLLNWLEHSN